MNMIKAIAFDLQFTLVSLKDFSLQNWFKIFDEGFKDIIPFLYKKGFEFDEKKLYSTLRRKRNKYFAQTITDDQRYYTEEILNETFSKLNINLTPSDFDRCIHIYHDKETRAWKPDKKLSIPLQDIIQNLSKKYKLAIITNAIQYVTDEILRIQGIRDYFDLIIADARKPRLPSFQQFQEKMNANPNELVMVGDDIRADIEPAIFLGMNTIHLHRGYEYRHDDINQRISPSKKITRLDQIFEAILDL
ncbi:MAG: HAD family hydrolase [Candidatus Lokiarchaeota archaeon]|nr:HAD family hydrolase [Candidatus Lokiarchaeota archaeon]